LIGQFVEVITSSEKLAPIDNGGGYSRRRYISECAEESKSEDEKQ